MERCRAKDLLPSIKMNHHLCFCPVLRSPHALRPSSQDFGNVTHLIILFSRVSHSVHGTHRNNHTFAVGHNSPALTSFPTLTRLTSMFC
jgi:hypothetical protein